MWNQSEQPLDAISVLNAVPGNYLILAPNAPRFTILDATDAYLQATLKKREDIMGKSLFDIFPDNPQLPDATGVQNLSGSLHYVLTHKKEHRMEVQRYDVINPETGAYEYKVWSPFNKPVLDATGAVQYIIHIVEDVTARVKAAKHEASIQDIEKAFNLFMQAPVAVCIVKGGDYLVELANEEMLQFLGRNQAMLGKPLIESLPEAALQGLISILDLVRHTGAPYHTTNFPAVILINGIREQRYFDLVFKPYYQNPDDAEPTSIFCVAHNVTKQTLYQKELEESEYRFRTLIEEATVATGYYLGRELRIQYANDIMIRYWGKDASVIGKTFREAVPELISQSFFELLDNVYTTGIPYIGVEEEAFLRVDDILQPFYFNFTYKALRDKQGVIYGIHHMAIDVTQEVLAKRKLEAAEQKAKLAIASADLGTYEIDLNTNEMLVSARFEEIWGVANTTDRNAYARVIHPDDLLKREQAHQEARVTGNLHYEARLLTGNMQVRWVDVRGKMLFDPKHEPERLLGVVQDITEQKQFAAELTKRVQEQTTELVDAHATLVKNYAYFQHIIDRFLTPFASLVPIFEEGVIVDFWFKLTNEAYSKYSHTAPEQIKDKRVSEVFPEYFKIDAFERYAAVYNTGQAQTWELHYDVDGLDIYLQVNASKIGDEVLVHFTDFTTLKNLQLDLERKVEELERSNQNLEEFAYAASHDMKEPIRKIRFFADQLKHQIGGQLNEEQRRLFSRMEYAASRMNMLIEDLLTYSYVSRGTSHLETVDLNHKVQNVLEDLELEIDQKQAKVIVASLPTITGHKRQIQQLFQNLIGNALKYSKPNEPPVIHISSTLVHGYETALALKGDEGNRRYHLIEVQDNGVGFDQEDADRIFNMFTRLHGNAEYKGSGVGLSIVRKVAENHKGYIWATGKAGRGATFHVLLPAE